MCHGLGVFEFQVAEKIPVPFLPLSCFLVVVSLLVSRVKPLSETRFCFPSEGSAVAARPCWEAAELAAEAEERAIVSEGRIFYPRTHPNHQVKINPVEHPGGGRVEYWSGSSDHPVSRALASERGLQPRA